MAEASFEALRKVQLHEKHNAQLTELEEDFFECYRILLHQMRDRVRKDFSIEAASALEGMQRLLGEVMRRREQKIFLKALRDFHAGEVNSSGLAREEKEVYNSIVNLLAEYEARQLGSVMPAAQEEKSDLVSVLLLADLPAFVGSRGQLGPFSAKQKTQLPREDARLLIEKGMAQET